MKPEQAVKKYQCLGCVSGDPSCFSKEEGLSVSCSKHRAGTTLAPGMMRIFLGLPKGFCRLGNQKDMKIFIYKTQEDQEKEWKYSKFNVPVWKHKNKHGHILVRGYTPRLNMGFIHVILKGNFDKIDAIEITEKDIKEMD